METLNLPRQSENEPQSPSQLLCPVCSGYLVLLRGFYRCTRCGCNLCESCDQLPVDDE